MKKIIYRFLLAIISSASFVACSDFLDRDPDKILSNEQIFSEEIMIKSVIANFYGRINWGQHVRDYEQYIYIDEACSSRENPDQTKDFGNGHWRVYDYGLIREINLFLKDLRATEVLSDTEKKQYEAEVRFIRAWTYFNMCRSMGGMPIVGDVIFDYKPGMDVTTLQYTRSTEAELYDYIIKECEEIAPMMSDAPTVNGARANRWTAQMLRARAAIYAGSIAKYNSLITPQITTEGAEVGIAADKANGYYQIALAASQEVIKSGKYTLQDARSDKGVNFYEAVTVKDNNTEIIWSQDNKYPGYAHEFTTGNSPFSHKEDIDANNIVPVLNLVEDFEYKTQRNGSLKLRDDNGEYIYYDNAKDVFADKDARLYGTVIYPGSVYKGKEVYYQSGQKYMEDGVWKNRIGARGSVDSEGDILTAENGPIRDNTNFTNKSGFNIRKFIDETPASGTRGRGSEVWFTRFRFSEALLIAAEANMELGNAADAITQINKVRARGGIQDLTSIDLEDIVRERRVEFAYENHRYWDLKRWRKAHTVWNGEDGNPKAKMYALFPYKIKDATHPQNGKWVFDKQAAHMAPYPRYFQYRNYYNFIDQSWINNNPKLVKNPYQ